MYTMSVFKLPDSLCKDLNSLMGNFLWGQKERESAKVSFLHAQLGRRPSYAWRSIMAAKEINVKGSQWNIGNGQRVNIGRISGSQDQNPSKYLAHDSPSMK